MSLYLRDKSDAGVEIKNVENKLMYRKLRSFIYVTLVASLAAISLSGCTNINRFNNSYTNNPVPPSAMHYTVNGKSYSVLKSNKGYDVKGTASWYGPQFNHKMMTSGTRFNMYKLTAASKTLPLYSYVLVTNLSNGKQVIVKITDRGPFVGNRILDLSYGAAKKLGMVGQGTASVNIRAITPA